MTRPRASTLALGALLVVASACGTQTPGDGGTPSPSTHSASSTSTPSASSSSTPTTTTTPEPTKESGPQRVYWEDLEPGMCVDTRIHKSDYDMWVLPCTSKHNREVIANGTLPGTSKWPGDRAVDKAATATCKAAFKKYVGVSYNSSDLQLDYNTTVKEDWQEGYRTVVCFVFDPDHKSIKHSLKSSGQ